MGKHTDKYNFRRNTVITLKEVAPLRFKSVKILFIFGAAEKCLSVGGAEVSFEGVGF